MFSKAENAAAKQAFWTAFGRYMQPVSGADGEPKKWLNYETNVSGLYVRVLLIGNAAYAGFEVADAASEHGSQLADLLAKTAPLLRKHTATNWDLLSVPDRPAESLFIGTSLSGKSATLQTNWPDLISFFKSALLAIDAYWAETGFAFEMLR